MSSQTQSGNEGISAGPVGDRAFPQMAGAVESPLLWMFRRKDKSGETLIGAAAFAAGERLRADMTFSGMLPSVTMNWSGQPSASRSGETARLNPTEAAIAARQRVDAAMRAVGPEFSGPLTDLCGFCKGLELIERERGWPARSAKIVVRMALGSLARHYGYDDAARGQERGRITAWQAPGALCGPRGLNARSDQPVIAGQLLQVHERTRTDMGDDLRSGKCAKVQ
jgi:hypothetical protein